MGAGPVMIGGDAARAATLGAVPAVPGDARSGLAELLVVAAGHFAACAGAAAPILIVDGPEDAAARAALLDAGAADVVPVGADPIEVRARIRAILRRAAPMTCADLAIDLGERRALRGGRPIALHPREFAVLAHLARHRDRAVSRRALYGAVWQRDFDPGTNVVTVAVSRLRAKVDAGAARLIHTMGDGYMLSAIAGG